MATANEIKSLSDQELTHQLFRVERELVKARFDHSMGQLENTAALREMRKDIARIKTEARRRELEQDMPKDSLIRQHRSSFVPDSTGAEAAPQEERGGFLKGIVDKLKPNE
jgi:large subunit ribosomal protein L29